MERKYWLAGVAALAFFGISAGAQAGPLGSSTGDLQTAAERLTNTHEVAYRRCWWRNGIRRCRWYDGDRVYGYRYYPRGPDAYPTGSTAWWREMDRENRGGHGSRR
jgi:hypothetical protein